jgi:hypothetical protein
MLRDAIVFLSGSLAGALINEGVAHFFRDRSGRRERLRVALRPIYTDLTDALDFHREQAATRQHPGATHAAMIAGMRAILDDPVIPWPDGARRRAEALTAQYAQNGDNDAQAAADAAEALRQYLGGLLR